MSRKGLVKHLAFLIVLGALAAPLHAQSADPNTERGVAPGKAYAYGNVDTVNLFNGNLNATIPIGQQYHVGGELSYGLSLNFGGNGWENGHRNIQQPGCGDCMITYDWSFPSRRANAGFGWILSLGSIFQKDGAYINDWTYEAPDGSLHDVRAPKLHSLDANETVTPNVYYSTDGTYLRFTIGSDFLKLEFPNGITHTFDKSTSYPGKGRLKSIDDLYGNFLKVTYNDPLIPDATEYGGTTWHLNDSHGRHHYVYFKPVAAYNELSSTAGGVVSHEAVAEVRLQTFGGAHSSYLFHYEGEENSTWSTLDRPTAQRPDPLLGPTTAATILTSVVVPDDSSSTYAMTYDYGFQSHFEGALTSLTLPTKGKIVWTYQQWSLNNPAGTAAPAASYPGVASRTVLDASDVPIARTDYSQVLNDANATIAPEEQTTVTVRSGDGSTILSRSIHYFSTCVTTRNAGGGPVVGKCTYPTGDYGLPFTRVPRTNVNPDASGTRFLSSQILTPDVNGNWTIPSRSVYLRYEADKLSTPSWLLDVNRRVASRRTVYEDGKIADENYSQFDGLGHYRQQTTGGTFGRADTRTSFTNFNPLAGTFALTSGGTVAPGYVMPILTNWILGTHTYSAVTETLPGTSTSTTSMVQVCFDTKGFLTRRRTLEAPVPNPLNPPVGATDVLAVFTPSTGGEIAREQYLGGDKGPAVPNGTCHDPISAEAYRIDHTYSFGSLSTSQYYDEFGQALSFKIVDQDIDPSTGFVKTSRERADTSGAGLVTNYFYDALGRVTDIQPAVGALRGSWAEFVYAMNPPRVDAYHRPNGGGTTALTHTATQFDVLGRVWRESRDMPDGTTSVRETLYNGAGWKTSVSEEAAAPANWTSFSYDAFGRPTTITAPDGSSVSLVYTGTSAVQRTIGVRTAGDATVTSGPSAITNSVTTERYDRQSRLWKVTDPAGTVTEYTYDIGGRLSKVCMKLSGTSCGQTRLFDYDNRGFLESETHPEKGAAGNGSTQFFDYDARGHFTRRLEGAAGGAFDLAYAYDRAERLKSVSLTSGRPLKKYFYGTSNDIPAGNYRNGKLTEAIRYNWFDALNYGIQISELYTYAGKDGRASARQTADYECLIVPGPCTAEHAGTKRTVFDQTFSYDDIGQALTLGYPTCSHAGCGGVVPTAPTATNTYSKGFLTSVTWTGSPAMNTISYWPNGLVKQVVHANTVVDTQGLDPNGMRRPAYISTSGATDNSSCTAPTITVPPASMTIGSAGVTLSVTVSADTDTTNHPLSYQWYSGSSGETGAPITGQTGSAMFRNTAGSYWVRVWSNCGSVNSPAAVLTMCTAPAISVHPVSKSITASMQATLTVTATGDTPSFQWYQGFSPSTAAPMPGQTGDSLTVTPDTTTRYWARVTNDCGAANSSTATVTVFAAPSTPTGVAADFTGSSMTISWSAASAPAGFDRYEVQRASDGNGFVLVGSSSTTSRTDGTFIYGKAFLYRVRTVDVNQIASPWSTTALATAFNFTDPSLGSGSAFRAVHISELRQAIDAVRLTASLPPYWASYAPPTDAPSFVTDLRNMREALDEARGVLGLPEIGYSNPGVASGSPAFFWHILELRDGIK